MTQPGLTRAAWRDASAGYGHLRPLFETAGTPAWETARERLITEYLPVAEHIAQRFNHRGEAHDDLLQVATVGLINAVDRFDPGRGTDFLAFAIPTIMGEVRRHFRDTGWSVRVPRRLQERHLAITAACAELAQTLGRAAAPSELAARLGLSKEEIYEGIEAGNVYRAQSLDEILGPGEDDGPVADRLGAEDDAIEGVEYHETLRPLLEQLPARERRILLLRFYGNLTQTEIARRVGLSQMHVSRLLSKTLKNLRDGITQG
ncbi:RNA polymerase sigma factor SigF [Alloactinosynnema sp. L-07]|uniref:RNA polymerase sigma factor SigF n=1 Tax=Alloactinosynnema sp. L-07 TaxID=1653480 RepID=UPI0006B665C1|nr:RNA polymerase sigma factor SigF [Alloactinosynnema sp. L-07]